MKVELVCYCPKCGKLAKIAGLIATKEGYASSLYKYKCKYCGEGKILASDTFWRDIK